jgi:tetratricopeptide (TPR) repeat protein
LKARYLLPLLFFLAAILAPAFVLAQIGPDTGDRDGNLVERILTQAVEYLAVSKYNEAIALFDTIPQPQRDSSSLRLLRASILSSAGRFAEARTGVEAVLAAEPGNIDALFMLASIEGVSGRRQQQIRALERIIAIESDNAEALISLGNVSLETRAYRQAAAYFHQVLSNDGRNAEAMLGLARALRMNTEWDNAEILLDRVVSLYPNMVEARSDRARFYLGRGRYREALEDFDAAIKLSPNDFYLAIDKANLLLEMDRKPEALAEFSRAIAINPNNYLPYAYTAGMKDEFGDHEGAERDYAILARLKPDYYFALEGLGLHKMRKGQWAEARDAFAEAYRQAPNEHYFALLTAICWMRMGDVTAPRTFLNQAQNRVTRNTLEWYMFRLYYDLTSRNYQSEYDMVTRLDREQDETIKARMLFYMAWYYDVRGNTALANRYFLMVNELDKKAIPEWRLNDWILRDRGINPLKF